MNVIFSNNRLSSTPKYKMEKNVNENNQTKKFDNILNSYSAITQDRYAFNKLKSKLDVIA